MRKMLLLNALWALFLSVCSVGVASAGVNGPEEYDGHGYGNCEAPTHLSWYDPRNDGQTIYHPEDPNGDNVYYVDTNPLAGFKAGGNYPWGQQSEDCQGTPALRQTAYVAVTFHDQNGYIRKGWPTCPRSWGDDRNPSCEDEHTGASGAVYVGTGDRSRGVGYSAGATPFWDGG